MQMETKFLRLRTPVELGSQFGDWQVCWLGEWVRFRLHYLVMLVKAPPRDVHWHATNRIIDLAFGANRAMNGVAMNTFTIDQNNNITAFASQEQARAQDSQRRVFRLFPGTGHPGRLLASNPPGRSVEQLRSGRAIHRPQAGEEIHEP
jgi:hypothetical protein